MMCHDHKMYLGIQIKKKKKRPKLHTVKHHLPVHTYVELYVVPPHVYKNNYFLLYIKILISLSSLCNVFCNFIK